MDYTTVRNKFWNGIEKEVEYCFDDKGFKHAILRAFRDLTQRTMKRKNPSKSVAITELREYVCDDKNYTSDKKTFFKLLEEYFSTDNYSDYNKWHQLACESIETCLSNYYEDESVSYGKAQKVVNMTMKGIYCLKGAESHVEKFKPCHMALDYFTLEWFYRCCKTDKNKDEVFAKDVGRKNLSVWSNMKKETEELVDANTPKREKYNLWGYYDIQEKIAKLVETFKDDNDEPITPFEAEFFVWPQMQITIAAEALYSNFKDEKELKNFKLKNVKEKYQILENLFSSTTHTDPCFI